MNKTKSSKKKNSSKSRLLSALVVVILLAVALAFLKWQDIKKNQDVPKTQDGPTVTVTAEDFPEFSGEIEKAEAEAREKRVRHMENQKEILARIESLVKAGNTDGKHPIKVADVARETKDKFLDREVGLWKELYGMYAKDADADFCDKMADGLITRFAKNYYNSDDAAASFAEVPEEELRSWISVASTFSCSSGPTAITHAFTA